MNMYIYTYMYLFIRQYHPNCCTFFLFFNKARSLEQLGLRAFAQGLNSESTLPRESEVVALQSQAQRPDPRSHTPPPTIAFSTENYAEMPFSK